jgi:hypothetical protein
MNRGVEKLSVGKLQGQVLTDYKSFFDEESLGGLGERARSAKDGVLSEGRHRVVVLDFEKNREVSEGGGESLWEAGIS